MIVSRNLHVFVDGHLDETVIGIVVLLEVTDIGVDFGEDEGGVVDVANVALADGFNGSRPAAISFVTRFLGG